MSYYKEWAMARKEVMNFRNILTANRIAGASIFLAVTFLSLFFELFSVMIMAFAIAFITAIWILDFRLSAMMEMAAKRSREIEKTYMKGSSIGHKVVESGEMGFLVRKPSLIFYTIFIVFGFAMAWYTMVLRHSSFLSAFYALSVAYIAFYFYWIMQIEKTA